MSPLMSSLDKLSLSRAGLEQGRVNGARALHTPHYFRASANNPPFLGQGMGTQYWRGRARTSGAVQKEPDPTGSPLWV